ncbi:MAG TPA: NAD(P)-binding domain-containing protein [Gemmatimonadaceae bacterium]|nr:NAD(P)-binding domain-containing protein [Gemmatimonadaceae bacterium]
MSRPNRWLIVGAGPSGLAAGRALRESGVPFDIVERHRDVGGLWDLDNPGTAMYESAHFISSKTCSAFDGFPMPASYPDYPSQPLILDYIRAFADAFQLRPHIEHGVEVVRATPVGDSGWDVELGTGETRSYRGVIAAVGHNWDPILPTYPGRFDGEAYHSVKYRSPTEFEGKRVLIVGGGNSGCDIACDAATRARRTFISLRRGYHFLPKHVFGKPTDAFFRSGPQLHPLIAQPLLTGLLRLLVGDLRRYGLPAPDHRVLETHPIMNTQILHYLAHGDVSARPDVVRLDGARVHFADGTAEDVDLIVWATGYRPTIPFLASAVPHRGALGPELFAALLPTTAQNLFVLGHFESDGGADPRVSKQAELVALLARADAADPVAARRWIGELTSQRRPELGGGVRYVASPRHANYAQFETYESYLRRLIRRARKELRVEASSAVHLPLAADPLHH